MVPLFDPYAGWCTLVSTTEQKGLFGMPYCNKGWHTKQVSDKHQFQWTDCCHLPCKGSRAICPLHFSDELCHLQAIFECYYPPASSAPTSSCCCTASTSYPSKTCWHGTQRWYNQDHSLHWYIPHLHHLSCFLHFITHWSVTAALLFFNSRAAAFHMACALTNLHCLGGHVMLSLHKVNWSHILCSKALVLAPSTSSLC